MLLETRSGRHRQIPVRTTLEAEDRCQAVTWGSANYVITSFPARRTAVSLASRLSFSLSLSRLLSFARVSCVHSRNAKITKYSGRNCWRVCSVRLCDDLLTRRHRWEHNKRVCICVRLNENLARGKSCLSNFHEFRKCRWRTCISL